MTRWTTEDVNAVLTKQAKAQRPTKYRAQAVMVDGIRFASKKEASRYAALKMMQTAKMIRDLECQPRFCLYALVTNPQNDDERLSGVSVGEYVADFRYTRIEDDADIIEDVKSDATRTALYKLKKKIVEACYGFAITEV